MSRETGIERFAPGYDKRLGGPYPRPTPNGGFVRYSDHIALLTEEQERVERLERALEWIRRFVTESAPEEEALLSVVNEALQPAQLLAPDQATPDSGNDCDSEKDEADRG